MPHCLPTIKRTNRLRQTGLTLVELMTTLAVLAVLAAIAAPSFTSLFERWRTSQAISAFESTWLLHARKPFAAEEASPSFEALRKIVAVRPATHGNVAGLSV